MRTAKLVGKLWDDAEAAAETAVGTAAAGAHTGAIISAADSGFFVDLREPRAVLERLRREGREWVFGGDLREGLEWLLLLPGKERGGEGEREKGREGEGGRGEGGGGR